MNFSIFKKSSICLVALGFLFSAGPAANTPAQENKKQDNERVSAVRDNYIISARAGGVNFVSGDVFVARPSGGGNDPLKKGEAVEVGERVSTGESGRAEILLNPGSFLRLAGGSEFEFLTTDLDDLRVRINSGSAILEVLATEEFRVTVNTPKSQFFIVKSGIYRVDALADGTAKLEVWKGKAQIGEGGKGKTLKNGQTAVIDDNSSSSAAQLAIAKFDRDDKDEFDLWSKDRAKELDRVNASLQRRQMNQALLASMSTNSWNVRNSFGLWVRDPLSQNYCFLPFGYGWSSPYGHYYDRSIWNYQPVTQTIYNNNPNWTPPNTGQGPATPPVYQPPQQPGGNGDMGRGGIRPVPTAPNPSPIGDSPSSGGGGGSKPGRTNPRVD